ncbi:4'-phosphopantetheinyl transferase [Actinoplanes cyaneus]|uniref:4'-phosphopantetheinyl transferase n=1 Tax=Actinoplanes cyaneus TaxID=52696 RepID=A0A919IIZ8_9ACTN|nr:4'-phosphopantetheinyl transferase superfamily protein [Actinoplanes cyaneus]MCW2138234.1 4'-phosphopantetheinyl transferase [Actinoplanes cyaneus]GID66192.1 4'-phosphopantetheinyl transferase [Actinoplanes cyaneus]
MTDGVRIWRIPLDLPSRSAARLAAALTPDERDRAGAYRDPVAGRTFLVVRAAARLVLGAHLAVPPDRVPLVAGPYGKPEVDGRPVHFNVSHTRHAALLALCRNREVGVDIEHDRYRSTAATLAGRFLSAADAAAVRDGGSATYVGLWVRKEACVKAAGGRLIDGLRLPVGTPVVADPRGRLTGHWTVRDLPAPAGYAAAVALAGADPYRVRMRDWHPARASARSRA